MNWLGLESHGFNGYGHRNLVIYTTIVTWKKFFLCTSLVMWQNYFDMTSVVQIWKITKQWKYHFQFSDVCTRHRVIHVYCCTHLITLMNYKQCYLDYRDWLLLFICSTCCDVCIALDIVINANGQCILSFYCSAGWANSITGQNCLSVCLSVNQGGINHNHYT